MANNIVTVNIFQTIAPAPSTLQGTGAIISQGGTTNAVNSLTLLTQASSLTASLFVPLALTSLTWSTGVVTATTAVAHGLTSAQVYQLTIAGESPTAYNGNYACTITGASTFTYALASNPGAQVTAGTWAPVSRSVLQQQVTTFFAQGSSVGVYILELGLSSTTAAVALLSTWIGNNLSTVYSYLVPREWDANAAFITLLGTFEATTAKTYFFITTTNSNYSNYTALMKCAFTLIEAPTIGATEFSMAAPWWVTLSYAPSTTNKVAPLAFSFLFGVTPYPTVGNSTIMAAWKTAGVNWVGTGSEGGISTAVLFWGTMMDLNPFNYWYSVDWAQINSDLNIANAVINGSNNPINPLYLNQDGINRLQTVIASTMSSGVTFGLLLGTVLQTELNGTAFTANLETGVYAGNVVINAVPFVDYYTANPGDYAIGKYAGFSATITPLRGFVSITFNINVTNFVAQ